ncbi:MAG: hypothetical protein HUK20_09895, partial [Fibrobacter sp.]|nr:hypothetical protein [Fibrobacter sp.]
GRLYTWAAAMNLESKYNSSDADDLVQTKHQGICPEGWHIPTNAEWSTLESHVDGLDDVDNNAGHWLKTQYGWSGASGNDGVGFSVLPTGCRYDSDYFSGLGSSASFWSASEYSSGGVYYLLLLSGYSSLGNDYDGKSIGLSVRCLQD